MNVTSCLVWCVHTFILCGIATSGKFTLCCDILFSCVVLLDLESLLMMWCFLFLCGIARSGKFTLCYDDVLSYVVLLDLESLLYTVICCDICHMCSQTMKSASHPYQELYTCYHLKHACSDKRSLMTCNMFFIVVHRTMVCFCIVFLLLRVMFLLFLLSVAHLMDSCAL